MKGCSSGLSCRASTLSVFFCCIALGMTVGGAPASALACGETTTVRDFVKPLTTMKRIQGPPQSGRMPFAPKGMSLEASGTGFVVGGGWIGFALRDKAFDHVRRLNWVVQTDLLRVDRRGRVLASLGVSRRRLGSSESGSIKDFLHYISGDPAFYRVDISFFRRGADRVLGRYSTYARLVRPRVDVRVAIETPAVFPGELAEAKLVNLGTVPFSSSYPDFGFSVQAFTGESWIRVSERRRWRLPKLRWKMYRLPAGTELTGCLRYPVPPEQAPGLFRFFVPGAPEELPSSVPLNAEFMVGSLPAE